jgi:hypothetical protein
MTGAIAIVALALVLGIVASYGWRLMRRTNREKAALLSTLVGCQVTLLVQSGYGRVFPRPCVVLRMEHNAVVVRDVTTPGVSVLLVPPASHLDERVLALAGIREVRQGDHSLGHW